jgi:hypothetical protein
MKSNFKSIATTFINKLFGKKAKTISDHILHIQKEEKKEAKDWGGEKLHAHPYNGTNNRKKTLSRLKADKKIQSIPCYEKDKEGNRIKLLGYRYVPVNEPKRKHTV